MSVIAMTLRLSSCLLAGPATVWAQASTFRGINAELWPLHMSAPASARLDGHTPLGLPWFCSVLTLARVVPLDLHRFTFLELVPGEHFRESSQSLLQRRWAHTRSLSVCGTGTLLSDVVELEPRLFSSALHKLVRIAFERRHASLRRTFGVRRCDLHGQQADLGS